MPKKVSKKKRGKAAGKAGGGGTGKRAAKTGRKRSRANNKGRAAARAMQKPAGRVAGRPASRHSPKPKMPDAASAGSRELKQKAGSSVLLRLGQRKQKKKALGADMWKKVDSGLAGKSFEQGPVDRYLDDFERSHRESVSGPVKVRKKDEHVDFERIKTEIEKNLGRVWSPEGGLSGETSLKPHSTTISTKIGKQVMIKSGIRGLDDILGGGLPMDSITLLSGTCGTGKSIFGMNFLIEGAMKGEPGIYISLEESPESNIQQMKLFGWPVDELIKRKKLMILQPELYNFDALLTTIEDSIDRIKAKRLVIDAISIIGMYFEDPYKVRKSILQLGSLLKKMKCTTIAIDEVREGEPSLSAYGVEEFVVDGVIVLYLIKRSNIYLRAAVIRKMRGVNHSTKIHPMEIKSPGGIVIYPSQELFEEIS